MSPFIRSVAVILVAGAVTLGCSGDDSGSSDPADDDQLGPLPVDDTVVDAVDDSPFCQAMLEIGTVEGDGLVRDDDPDSATSDLDDLVALYVDVASDVPAEIRPDFDVVLERLVAAANGEEVADPERAEESAIELAAFIERQCRGTSINPLPPPTVPGNVQVDD